MVNGTYNDRPRELESRIWSIERRHIQWLWTVPLQGHAILWRWISQKRYEIHSYMEILIDTYALLKSVISNDLEWPRVTLSLDIQWHNASRGLSATAELLVKDIFHADEERHMARVYVVSSVWYFTALYQLHLIGNYLVYRTHLLLSSQTSWQCGRF